MYSVSGQARRAALCSREVDDFHVDADRGRSRRFVEVEVEETKLPQELGKLLNFQGPWEKHGYEVCQPMPVHDCSVSRVQEHILLV